MFSGCHAGGLHLRGFLGVAYLRWMDPSFALFIKGIGLVIFSTLRATIPGKGGIACLFMIYTSSSRKVCYPVIFSSLWGCPVVPSIQGAVSDAISTWRSFIIPLTGFVPLLCYGGVMWVINSKKYHGRLTIWTSQTNVNVEESTGQYTPEVGARDDIEKSAFLEHNEKPVVESRERV
ncbi:hypothetical protein L198_03878 [Cryptococcus wingfieldii CBS 7118]|uniref:Uncharacterized protein n=1 Tax=Cryptococcus wingfieldii CBS 7118 TaxID=1295528 RepID=A0A1E3J9G8_9TREE|nr:hypothetical protein L198_03878 [Cryptococcus wingfieldii CBS 7118]ODN97315.1 hypothetical protein L198_03878 [Cryptococcus wingfieldii CBS 7118]